MFGGADLADFFNMSINNTKTEKRTNLGRTPKAHVHSTYVLHQSWAANPSTTLWLLIL